MERRDLSQLFSPTTSQSLEACSGRTAGPVDALWRCIFCLLICAFPVCGTALAQRESGTADQHYARGVASLQTRDFAAAERELRAALRLRPNDARAHNALGLALGAGGRLDQAVGEFREAVKLAPDFAEARVN